ncbi:LPS export ABC transporter ATP-binding protein [Halieaceae bacterium IMCC14734]|uniref:Lipopolysaccharide export system ATP-binding protein LptB n=1 Tax=Candidatus Litorirhabdus singularis TaxID=2518993 RepID=A0ABT3TL38_9GAMM|nr:LPS export ABC transporter ATP-binding protein [Candidatus Litorirhabdus singularis]MCX2982456.1 LPS export ABC transporter ATP-binding protein [Candidatus Litorirhabdus singularis]
MGLLKANNLAKSYGGRSVVKDVSMEVERGQIVGLLGPNGCGKTTCFYMIVGIIAADQGNVSIDDEDITALPMHGRARRGIGYLPQEASIFRKLSVTQNIYSILETRKDLNRAQRLEKLESLLEEFHITHIRDSKGIALSGGERRRVEIARSLATDPDFILLDEPFAGVDPISINDIKQIVKQLQSRGIGTLITDHNVRDTLDICEKAFIMGEGHIIAAGTADDILNNEKVRSTYLGEDFRL